MVGCITFSIDKCYSCLQPGNNLIPIKNGFNKPFITRAVNRLCNNRLINRLLLRVIDNRAMYATTNYTIGSHDHIIAYNLAIKSALK